MFYILTSKIINEALITSVVKVRNAKYEIRSVLFKVNLRINVN